MRRAFNILLCLCLTIAIWELYVMWGSLPEVLGSIKPVAGHGVVTNRSMGDTENPYRERTESSDARLNTTHRLTSLNDSNHGAGRVKTRSNFTAILNSNNKNERNQSRSLKQHKSVQVNGQKNATNQPEYRKTTPSKAINKHEQSESGSKKTKTQQGKSISNKTITENDIRQNSSKIKMTEERNLTELKHAGGKELPNSDKNVVPPKESHIQKVTTPNLSEKTYLFPLHYDYNGPNVQYSSFRFGVAFALTYNRTVVENWFSTHWTTGAKQIRYVNETFDMAKLQEIVDVASVNEFKEACNSTVDALLMHPYHRMGGRTKAQYLERFLWKQKGLEKRYAITLPGPSHIPQSSEEAEALLLNPPKTKCLGVLDPSIDTKWLFPALTKHFDTVNTHIVSPPNIMKMVDEVEKKLCDGDPFVAMHWRNRSGEICGRHTDQPCDAIYRIIQINRTAEVAAKDVKKLMDTRNMTCIYVAVPPFAVRMVKILKDAKIPRVRSAADIKNKDYPEIAKLQNDGYMFSILEQEICNRAKLFIRTLHSSWSDFANRGRQVRRNETLKLNDFISWKAPDIALKK